ncbi:uncharacterized protein CTHT_0026890 [Thermochaetoides thermophila DSM 1495]|uniref:Uncharacterized protein n=1 Tax=Chaetomium thermophilum (strain DSM 1495 / CBS 144.50 / IMI 039719) TaxID=759272 RepID=G0S6U3_CHATD|nr:hypothetical protein CTHT_0026890 [Thermochaetoides thermophila DSM 1495]EGS20851.1 hypothetical protein CTHT_0026890 [Thermochaetoides thermophila DSM 1495]
MRVYHARKDLLSTPSPCGCLELRSNDRGAHYDVCRWALLTGLDLLLQGSAVVKPAKGGVKRKWIPDNDPFPNDDRDNYNRSDNSDEDDDDDKRPDKRSRKIAQVGQDPEGQALALATNQEQFSVIIGSVVVGSGPVPQIESFEYETLMEEIPPFPGLAVSADLVLAIRFADILAVAIALAATLFATARGRRRSENESKNDNGVVLEWLFILSAMHP